MRAVVLKKPETLVIEDIKRPEADEDFLIVAPKACGICGSDVRYYKGENPWALHTLGKNLPNPPNIVLGHEFAGIVEQVKNPEYKYLLGKRVSVLAFDTCKKCEACLTDQYNLCHNTQHIGHGAGWGEMDYYPGGMADYCQVWNTHVVELPDSVSFSEATLLDPISVGIHAISISRIKPGDNVLVLGSGPVGLSIAQAVKGFGADKVVCTDISEHSLNMARKLNIDYAVNVREESEKDAVSKVFGKKANVIFDTIGSSKSQRVGLELLAGGGTLVNLVANLTDCYYSLQDLTPEKRIICSANNRTEDYLLGLKFIENGVIDAKAMITHTIPLEDVQKGFDMLLDREATGAVKVVLEI